MDIIIDAVLVVLRKLEAAVAMAAIVFVLVCAGGLSEWASSEYRHG